MSSCQNPTDVLPTAFRAPDDFGTTNNGNAGGTNCSPGGALNWPMLSTKLGDWFSVGWRSSDGIVNVNARDAATPGSRAWRRGWLAGGRVEAAV